MLKTLIKKQLLGLFRGFFVNQKKGTAKSRVASIVSILLYAGVMIFLIGGMFWVLSITLCEPLVEVGMGWLYYAMMGLLAVFLGVFGSVFNTFASLYNAKDNDLLLSMPIPVSHIMLSRLVAVYLMGLMFSVVVYVPALIVYLQITGLTAGKLLWGIVMMVVLSLFVMVLSCALGWVVAKISSRLKNKSFVVVLASLAFFAAYYYVYFRATAMLGDFLANAVTIGAELKGKVYPLYVLGAACEGNVLAVLAVAAIVIALLGLVCYLISRSFLKLATGGNTTGHVRYREKKTAQKGISAALYGKEMSMFLSKPNYILNCGLGILMLPVAAVLLLVKGAGMVETLDMVFFGRRDFFAVMAMAAMGFACSMNDMAAPSVSLEGKALWIAQSLPVTPWMVLRAKLSLQLSLTLIPALLVTGCLIWLLQPGVVISLLMILLTAAMVAFFATMDLTTGLWKANLSWTNEIYPIKQSFSVMVALFGAMGYSVVLGGGYVLLDGTLSAAAYLGIFTVVTAAAAGILFRLLRTKGSVKFAEL